MKKYYVIMLCAEENYGYIKYLTRREAEIFDTILDDRDAMYRAGGRYCGGCSISEGFDTIEEAEEFLRIMI